MSDYRPALETFADDTTGDTPAAQAHSEPRPDDLWRWFCAGIASRNRVRVARNGREFRRGWETELNPAHRPARPAAVSTFDHDGRTHCVVFDLDAKKSGQRAAVLRDCDRLTGWLSEAGCAWFVDESPAGGRHVYVPLREPLALAEVGPLLRGARASGALRTLDASPMLNLTEGCIRPPGSAHRLGGHQRLVTGVHAATAALHRRTTAAAWAAFAAIVPVPEVSQDDTYRLVRAVPDQPVPGSTRPLSAYYAAIAVTGAFDPSRYPSPSEARFAVIAHAVGHGWSESDIRAEISAGRWPGLSKLYADKYGPYASTALFGRGDDVAGDIRRAQDFVTSTPLHRSLTSASRPRGDGSRHETRLHLRRWYWAVGHALATGRWASRLSYGRENVLVALVSAARQVQARHVEYGARHLSYTGGAVVEWASAAAHLRALRSEDDPFVLLVEQSSGASADVYELVIPQSYLDTLPDDSELPELPSGIHPVFGMLSLPAFRVYTALRSARGALKAADLADTAGVPARTAWSVLAELEQHHLVARCGPGLWRIGRRSLDRVARDLGVAKKLRALVRTWRLERDAWRITLGLAPRELPPARNVAWPGRVRDSAALISTRPAETPAQRREREMAAVAAGAPDWREDLEAATAIELLRHRLGAVEIASTPRSASEAS